MGCLFVYFVQDLTLSNMRCGVDVTETEMSHYVRLLVVWNKHVVKHDNIQYELSLRKHQYFS